MTEPIKLPPLPEPDWYLVMSADGDNVNVELQASDEDAVNAALDMSGIAEIHRLIIIEKVEAYAIAAIEADRQVRGGDQTGQKMPAIRMSTGIGGGAQDGGAA